MGAKSKLKKMPFFLGAPCTAEIIFDQQETINVPKDKEILTLPLYPSTDAIKGTAKVILNSSKKVEHHGITIDLIGQIEMFYDRGDHFQFTSVSKELAPAGEITESLEFPFDFSGIEKQYESFNGINVRLRYFVRLKVNIKNSLSNAVCEKDFWVVVYQPPPEINNSLKMEVGIEDTLHIEFEYNKAKYHLKDVIIGKIYFLLVRLKIKHMEIALIKRESAGSGPSLYNENETLTKFEIMEGAPVRGESVPVRLFLSGFDLHPTYRNVASKFSVKYYLNLVLVDEDDRRYFKQQEITLWRKNDRTGVEEVHNPTQKFD